jgi:DNA-directed RNA polymerase subunit beta'
LKESRGEVKPETINYRTHKPERDGLFCERILDQLKILNVLVENTKESVTKESFDRCGVEVTEKKVRRDRVGHINLLCQLLISGISVLFQTKLDTYLPSKKLDMIIYYERYVVIQAGIAKKNEVKVKD